MSFFFGNTQTARLGLIVSLSFSYNTKLRRYWDAETDEITLITFKFIGSHSSWSFFCCQIHVHSLLSRSISCVIRRFIFPIVVWRARKCPSLSFRYHSSHSPWNDEWRLCSAQWKMKTWNAYTQHNWEEESESKCKQKQGLSAWLQLVSHLKAIFFRPARIRTWKNLSLVVLNFLPISGFLVDGLLLTWTLKVVRMVEIFFFSLRTHFEYANRISLLTATERSFVTFFFFCCYCCLLCFWRNLLFNH